MNNKVSAYCIDKNMSIKDAMRHMSEIGLKTLYIVDSNAGNPKNSFRGIKHSAYQKVC